jgi:hypothetical protein
VDYLPTAAAAASIAVALDVDRNLDRAVLAAFGRGAPVADEGVRSGAIRYLREIEDKASQAYGKHKSVRSDIPRRLRVPLSGSRRAGAWLASDAMLSLLLRKEPEAGRYGVAVVLDALVPEACTTLASESIRRIEFVMRRLSLAALRQVSRNVDIDRWREACVWVTSILEYGDALTELVTLTGSQVSVIPSPLRPLIPLTGLLNGQDGSTRNAPGFRTAILGLVGAALTATRRRTSSAREAAAVYRMETPKLRAIADLARDLPERWRPALALGSGPVFLSQLPDEECKQAIDHTRRWMSAHSVAARILLPNGNLPPLGGGNPATK